MAFLKTWTLGGAIRAALALTPLTAHAIEVECELEDGSSCTISNDPFDSVTCSCADEGGTGTSGGDSWADFDEAMLLEVCESQLSVCDSVDTEGGATTTVGTIGSESDSTSGGDTEGSTGYGTTGYGTGTTGDYGESTYGGESSSSTGSATSAGSGPGTDPAETTGSSASGGDPPAETTANDTAAGSDGGDSSSGGADQDSEDPSGCSVGDGEQSGGALLALFGLVMGLRRRRG